MRCIGDRIIVLGCSGSGKSTFASKFPAPLFVDTEGSTKQLDVQRFDDDMGKRENILAAVSYVASGQTDCKTLIIDTIDWAEQACINKLNKEHNTSNILTLDYGKGSLFVVGEFKTLMDKLDECIVRGINVVLLAHASMRKQELPEEMGAFDHWELKLQSKQVKSMVKEWADLVLFGNYKTFVIVDEKTKSKKAQGGKRVLYTEHHACWDAKNRHGLPAEIPFEFKSIEGIFEDVKPETPKLKEEAKPAAAAEEKPFIKTDMNPTEKQLHDLMDAAGYTEEEVMSTFHQKGKFDGIMVISEIDDWGFIEKSVIGNWDSFSKAVEKYGKGNPFLEHKKGRAK